MEVGKEGTESKGPRWDVHSLSMNSSREARVLGQRGRK